MLKQSEILTESNMNTFKRSIMAGSEAPDSVKDILQSNLETLIDLALVLKQAHWNVVGPNFRSVHLQLDEIIVTTREATDEIAERIVTIGKCPDGRAKTVAGGTKLEEFPNGFHNVTAMVCEVADRLLVAITQIRSGIEQLGELDLISEDMLIGISAQFEKHLWMVQAQEVS